MASISRDECAGIIRETKVIAVIRATAGADALVKTVEACAAGGVRCVELTMTSAGALPALEKASQAIAHTNAVLGVGSVLDAETARLAILAGAEFVVSPVLREDVIRMAKRYGKLVMAGAYTPTEILAAWELGSDFVKVFPADIGGPAHLKAVKGPLPQVELVPTGGVTAENTAEFLSAGAVAVGAGSSLAGAKLIDAHAFDQITENARAYAAAARQMSNG